jgi:hypothetical protein
VTAIAKGRARAYLNEHHPEHATRIRDRILGFRRLLAIEERIGGLERAVYAGVSGDQSIHAWETKVWSQNGEDGVLLNLFSRIGATSRRFLEFGCGTGLECNSANLALGFGWSGLLLDANTTHVTKARTFFDDHLGPDRARVSVRAGFVTPENINELLGEVTPEGRDVDLLSIDVDSIDYWIWHAVEGFRPRVVVCEYNPSFGPTRSVTVTSRAGFDPFTMHPSGYYHGASLTALHKLATAREYQLIGCESAGANAFFVRRDCANGLPDLRPEQCYVPHSWRPEDPEEQFRLIQHLPLTEV